MKSRMPFIWIGALAVLFAMASVAVPALHNEAPLDVIDSFSIANGVSAISWSMDGQTIAAVSDFGQTIYILDRDGVLQRTIHRTGDGPGLMDTIPFINPTEFVFVPPANSPPNTALGVWSSRTGEVQKLIDGPLPGQDFVKTELGKLHFVANHQQLLP